MRRAEPAATWRAATVRPDASGSGPLPLRPLGVLDLVDEPFRLLRHNLRTLILLAGAALAPLELLSAWLQRGTLGGLGMLDLLRDPVAGQVAVETVDPGIGQALLLQAAGAVTVYAVLEGVLARVAVSSLLGERLEPLEAVRATLRRWPGLMLVSLLVLLAVFGVGALGILLLALGGVVGALLGGLVLLAAIPVGVAAHVLLLAAPAVLVTEGGSPLSALRRSAQLVRRRFWAVLGALVLVTVVSGTVQSALAALPSFAAMLIGFEYGWPLTAAGAMAAGIVVSPYAALVAALVYVDGRVRSEALDLEILAERAVGDVGGLG